MGDTDIAEANLVDAVTQTSRAIQTQGVIINSLRRLGQSLERAIEEMKELEGNLADYVARLQILRDTR